MRNWLTGLALCLIPAQTLAGAWPRAPGTVFVSLSYSASGDRYSFGTPAFEMDGYSALYLEYGLTPWLTFGLDAGRADGGDYTVIAFLRRPLDIATGPDVFAVQAGIGTTRSAAVTETLAQVGLAWGRGIETRFGPGWLALDTSLMYRIDSGETVAKADLTLGVKPNDRTKLMAQFQAGVYPGSDPYLRLVPSIARKFGERTHIELGVSIGIAGDDRVGVKLGTWLEF